MRKEEGRLQDLMLKDLRSFGKYMACTKIERASDDGMCDVYFTTVRTGSVWVEVKKKHGEESAIQAKRIENLNRCGARAFVCNTWKRWVEIKREIGLDSFKACVKPVIASQIMK